MLFLLIFLIFYNVNVLLILYGMVNYVLEIVKLILILLVNLPLPMYHNAYVSLVGHLTPKLSYVPK